MSCNLHGLSVAVLGGDLRERLLVDALRDAGAAVRVAGFPAFAEWEDIPRLRTAAEAVRDADAVVGPMTGTDSAGYLRPGWPDIEPLRLDGATFRRMKANSVLLIGVARPVIEQLAARHRIRLIRTADLDEIAILNSIPTAEGAVAKAMMELPITIHGSRALVVGFGRCGLTLGRTLRALGAHTEVAARDRGQRARAYEMGLDAVGLDELRAAVAHADAVFNTVPAPVLTREVLQAAPKGQLIVDVAAAPGGTDFQAAGELGLRAFLERGIPGRVAPRTAGEILARCIPRIIQRTVRRS